MKSESAKSYKKESGAKGFRVLGMLFFQRRWSGKESLRRRVYESPE